MQTPPKKAAEFARTQTASERRKPNVIAQPPLAAKQLPHLHNKPQHTARARLHWFLDLPAKNERARVVLLRDEVSVHATLRRARHVLKPRGEVVGDRDVAQKLVA